MINNYKLAGGGSSLRITNPVVGDTLKNLLNNENPSAFLSTFLPNILTLLLIIGAVIFLFMMLLGGIGWITSGGDKAALEGAKGKITSAIIGIVLLISTFALIKVVESFFGINILTIDISQLIIQ